MMAERAKNRRFATVSVEVLNASVGKFLHELENSADVHIVSDDKGEFYTTFQLRAEDYPPSWDGRTFRVQFKPRGGYQFVETFGSKIEIEPPKSGGSTSDE